MGRTRCPAAALALAASIAVGACSATGGNRPSAATASSTTTAATGTSSGPHRRAAREKFFICDDVSPGPQIEWQDFMLWKQIIDKPTRDRAVAQILKMSHPCPGS